MAITAKLIAYSISEQGKKIATFELEYPRFIHAEVMTHRAFSKNGASSRAIPLKKMLKLVRGNMAMPVHWGKIQKGMQAKEELQGWRKALAKALWIGTGHVVCCAAQVMGWLGLHKQVVNRITEPWGHMKLVFTGTEWNNLYALRIHPDAQPEIRELVTAIWDAFREADLHPDTQAKLLRLGEWHLPYMTPALADELKYNEAAMLKMSASLCAQVSFRTLNDSVSKAESIFKTLVENKPVHASPTEHQATPAANRTDRSGNFVGWVQHRQLLSDHYVPG